MKIKHQGLSNNRLKSNPAEAAFAYEWHKLNVEQVGRRNGMLEFLLCSNNDGHVSRELTQPEATAVATVVQWLGSPVGIVWCEETLAKAKKAADRK